MANVHLKPFYTVDDVIEAACEQLADQPALADELRLVRRLVDPVKAKRFFRERRVASWAMVAETLGNECAAGRQLEALEEGDGIDAESITREIQRFRKRGNRWQKKLTFSATKT